MSTLQSDLGGGWGDDGFEWPDWMNRYDEPVVRATTKSEKKMHAPDLTADGPRPACVIGQRDSDSFVGADRAHLKGFYTECDRDECQQFFADGGER